MATATPAPLETHKTYRLVGGAVCLDFCNTVGGTREGTPKENFHCYPDLIDWCQQAGVLSRDQANILTRRAEEKPSEAARVFTQALDLRETIYRIFYSLVQRAKPAANDLSLLNEVLARTLGRLRITGIKDAYDWTWSNSELALDYPLGPLAYSAAILLVEGPELEPVRQCREGNCGWLFIDSSKNHSRCWCDMRDCGNRAKARRHRQKRHRG